MFGLPSLQTIVIAAVAPVLIAFAIVNYKQTWYSVTAFVFICINTWFAVSSYMTFMYDNWRGENNEQPCKPVESLDLQPTRASNDIPQIKVGGLVVHSQSVEPVSINAIKGFNQHLITQHMSNLPINMTENYWVKKNNGAEQSEWVRIGGTGPTDWKNMMERGVRWGAYGVEGGLEKRVPLNWRKISQLAQGYPLPQ